MCPALAIHVPVDLIGIACIFILRLKKLKHRKVK